MISRTASSTKFELGGLIERLSEPRVAGKRVSVRRPDDHLVLELFFENLRVEMNEREGARLIRTDRARAPPSDRGISGPEFCGTGVPSSRRSYRQGRGCA